MAHGQRKARARDTPLWPGPTSNITYVRLMDLNIDGQRLAGKSGVAGTAVKTNTELLGL